MSTTSYNAALDCDLSEISTRVDRIHYIGADLAIWHPPVDPFIEFDSRDYQWLQALGFGHMEKIEPIGRW